MRHRTARRGRSGRTGTLLWGLAAGLLVIVGSAAFFGLPGIVAAAGLVILVAAMAAYRDRNRARVTARGRQRRARQAGVAMLLGLGMIGTGGFGVEMAMSNPRAATEGPRLAAPSDAPDSPASETPAADERGERVPVPEPEPSPDASTTNAPAPDPSPMPGEGASAGPAEPRTALALLETLQVKGRAPKTGYAREELFGPAWADVDLNGCDTRNDILARDLVDTTVDDRCRVLTGTLTDPYTNRTIAFRRGADTSAEVQIDHVVALMDSWQKGAQQMTQEQRLRFANDPLNLLAVSGEANQQKGASDAASWLPANKAFRCEYVARQVSVKAAYGLWVTRAEQEQIARILSSCPDQPALMGERP